MFHTIHKVMSLDRNNVCGLQNLGATCYMNSILQILSSTSLMVLYVLNKDEPVYGFQPLFQQLRRLHGDQAELTVSWSLLQIIETMWTKNCLIEPIHFFKKIQKKFKEFQSRQQCDAHEFFTLLLDAINTETKDTDAQLQVPPSLTAVQEKYYRTLKHYFEQNNSFITRIYLSTLMNQIHCHRCGYTNHVFDHQMSLSIDIPENCRSVKDGLDSFFQESVLNADYKCDRCKQASSTTQKYSLYQTPNILSIHLKRFCQTKHNRLMKLSNRVDFDFQLDLTEYTTTDTNAQYELFGVVYHFGQLNNGHYIACAKHPVSNTWYMYDDETPRLVTNKEQIVNHNAYILFYKKK